LCITTSGRAGEQLVQYPCQANAVTQLWTAWVSTSSNGCTTNATFYNVWSGLVIDVSGGTQGTAVIAWYSNGGNNQKWELPDAPRPFWCNFL
jgi:hypothetical protein